MSKRIPLDVVDEQGNSFYVSERKVYPRDVSGRFNRLRVAAVVWLLGMYYLFPWLSWDGRQAVLFDLPARKFYIFGLVFWPQDFLFLALLLIIAAMTLFFSTALSGRLWCGYACPQTVWTETFLWMERWTEGDRPRRMKLDAGPWNREKVLRKGSKHLLWLLFALWTGFTFVGFFTPIKDLGARLLPFEWGGWETFWVLFYALATWGNAGVLREQVCKYMCPYARFQSAMFDRNGLQYECIACGACIDACDEVMDKVGYPHGLIRYSTQNAIDGKPTRVLRPRIFVYGLLLLGLCGAWVWGVGHRSELIAEVLRDRNALYRQSADGSIANDYTLKLINKSQETRRYRITLEPADAGLRLQGQTEVQAGPEQVLPVALNVVADGQVSGRRALRFVVEREGGGEKRVVESSFFGPVQ